MMNFTLKNTLIELNLIKKSVLLDTWKMFILAIFDQRLVSLEHRFFFIVYQIKVEKKFEKKLEKVESWKFEKS